MITVISPAKTLDFQSPRSTDKYTQPAFTKDAGMLVKILAKKSSKKLGALMDISPKLSDLNYERFQRYTDEHTDENARQALLAYKGDVYLGFELDAYTDEDFEFAQEHLRILSGLYGVLKPLDYIQPYRLEMKIRLKNRRGDNLYKFWGDRISKALNEDFSAEDNPTLINLASNEYFKAINPKTLKGEIIHINFKENRDGAFKTIALLAKKARGMMSNYIIQHRIDQAEGLKDFRAEDYAFNMNLSEGNNWVFTR